MFYRRLVAGTFSTTLKWALWVSIGSVLIYTIALSIFMFNMCYPLEADWMQYDPTYPRTYRCQSQSSLDGSAVAGGVLSVITDFISVTLPAILLYNIRLTKRQRLGMMFVFGLGYLYAPAPSTRVKTNTRPSTVVAGILRTIYLAQLQRSSDDDKTWIGFNTVAAGIAEGNIGIVCACAPSLHHYFKHFFGSATSTFSSRADGSAGLPSFVARSTASRSHAEPSAPRTPKAGSNGKWESMDEYDLDEEARPVSEAYESLPKGGGAEEHAVERPAAVFSHNPSQFRTLEQRMGEPRSFLHGPTDDEEDDSVHYSKGW
jgi:hypothetical protein